MPRLMTQDMEQHTIGGSSFGYSAKRIDTLGASEYTLVGIAADASPSVSSFRREIEKAIRETVQSCQRSPRSDNLMLRATQFNSTVTEIHGFLPLSECKLDSYDGCLKVGGCTALYDAAVSLSDSVVQYGKALNDQDYDCNAIIVVITDGEDNASTMTLVQVRQSLERAVQSEALESIVSILIGVNVQEPRMSQYLKDFHREAGFTQYVEIDNASASSLAKLAQFVSKSISAQSQALHSGGPSKPLTF